MENEVGDEDEEEGIWPLRLGWTLMGRMGDALAEMCWDIRWPSSVASRYSCKEASRASSSSFVKWPR